MCTNLFFFSPRQSAGVAMLSQVIVSLRGQTSNRIVTQMRHPSLLKDNQIVRDDIVSLCIALSSRSPRKYRYPCLLGRPDCRTKLPRKALISKRKMVRKTARNFPENFFALFCCVESLTGTVLKYFTANSRTKSNIFSRRESAGMATLTVCLLLPEKNKNVFGRP